MAWVIGIVTSVLILIGALVFALVRSAKKSAVLKDRQSAVEKIEVMDHAIDGLQQNMDADDHLAVVGRLQQRKSRRVQPEDTTDIPGRGVR